MNRVVHGGDAELLGAAPGYGPDIGVRLLVLFDHEPLGSVDLGHAEGDFEIQDAGGMVQPLGVLGALVNCPRIGALALEYRAGVVQAVGQHMDLGVDVGHELAVKPDDTGHLVEGHCHSFPPVRAPRPSR
jgi:hypothetical protein